MLNKLFLSKCSTIVIDEFDTLLDAGYSEDLHFLLEPLLLEYSEETMEYQKPPKDSPKSNRQVVFCSATVTKAIEKFIETYYPPNSPNFLNLIETKTHMNLSNLDHEFIHLSEQDKFRPLEMLLKEFKEYRK